MFLRNAQSRLQKSVSGQINTQIPIRFGGRCREQRNACGRLRMPVAPVGKIRNMAGWREAVSGRTGTEKSLICVLGPFNKSIFQDNFYEKSINISNLRYLLELEPYQSGTIFLK